RYPIQRESNNRAMVARITFPAKACLSKTKRAYAGPYPERFRVVVVSDTGRDLDDIKKRLADAGFTQVETEVRGSVLDGPVDTSYTEFYNGFVISWMDAGREALIASLLRDTMKAAMDQAGAKDFTIRTTDYYGGVSTDVRLYFPTKGVADGKLMSYLIDPRHFRLR